MFSNRFKDKVAIVTGAASGVGYAITNRLLQEGASVVGADLNQERLNALQSELGDRFLGVQTNVTQEDQIAELVEATVRKFGGLHIAFNVAGASKAGIIKNLSEADWDFTVDLCLKGVFLSMKHEALQMAKQGGGAIVNVASLNAHVPMYAGAAYSSAKAGVEMLTKNGALEMARDGIRVNAILPGLIETPLTAGLLASPDIQAAYLERIPMKRAAKPEEMTGPALFLASDDAGYVNGASLLVDGAWATSGYPDLSRWF
ncbi:SDR family NAD(P)-dependent oxidoreductase [Cohnella thailandensis]|uniref:SDR family oxidoreductase n=1 Tax=Cohnella thailandensis TaxID=557557 RepID=A0A841T2J3_9BACL|nr:SDR family NAD(P)-dependent oxidoreductase [Cohnella thailandensis]MBB6637822.1 SDR family oxidoreductase [Cohnella thailandensis]MBP1973998.1 NAD(P)-dependent dehydrogenase (short-subunit alcohol dehydrogenase family) [Cohnella thailandensis]